MERSSELKAAIMALWEDDAGVRLAAAKSIGEMVSGLVDVRSAQPALTLCLRDPDLRVAKAACRTTELRARLGADIGMAVPTLATLRDAEDQELRALARNAIAHANMRLPGIIQVLDGGLGGWGLNGVARPSQMPTMPPSAPPPSRGGHEPGPWGKKPWESHAAGLFFAKLFTGTDIDLEMEKTLALGRDHLEEVRAAAYLLQILGMAPVWPGSANKLKDYLTRARDILKSAIEEGVEDRIPPWVQDPEVVASIRDQIGQLASRIEAIRPE